MKKIINIIIFLVNSLIWQPLKGNDGVTQMDELAKYLITLSGIWMVFYEGVQSEQQFTDFQFGTVFGAVVAVAGLQMYFKKNK